MGRPRTARKQGVSLFPFLDILACVIGNLILIITTVVLEQVDTQPVAEAARIDDLREEAGRQQARAADLQKQVEELQRRSGTALGKLAEVRAKIAEAKRQLAEAETRAREADKPAPSPPAMAADLAKLERERNQIAGEIADLERQIADRKRQPEQMIAILPPGTGGGPRKGVFVEAAKDGLVIHEGAKPWRIPTGKVASDPQFKALLERVKKDGDAIVTFLVRADGLAALAAGQKATADAGVRSGRVPLPGQGGLDLSGAK
jgi:predicted RNase H-like nuclease (RuvC/YqgF family)